MSRMAFALVLALVTVGAVNASAQTRRVNAPYFPINVRAPEAGIFWFGRVDPLQNYADVRVAYTDTEVWIKLAVFDQWLWQDDAASRTPASLEGWDAATLVVDTGGGGTAPSTTSYRFVGELSWWRPRTDYQAAYVGNGTGWSLAPSTPFSTETNWRGDAPNNNGPDRGWVITFHIPYTTLGLASRPADGAVWRLGVQLHDKDAAATAAVSDKFWPEGFDRNRPSSWGQLAFGLRPSLTLPVPPSAVTHTIRHGLAGSVVADAMVGGGSTCAEGVDFFGAWGSVNHAGSTTLVVQNQADVADWPCFSKIYVDFPLAALPPGQSVVSASFTIYQFGGSDPSQAQRSLVQAFTVAEPWSEQSVTWNTAPLAVENVSQAWADPILAPLPWPGAARTFNLTWAVGAAYASGAQVLRLALYEADSAYHSGKYFTASETGDWNAAGRPTLQVILAQPDGAPGAPQNLRFVP